ncbi:MAG: ABC transporter ATP-binding protein [Bacteroidetes bacterium]|nr:ABC transporter ATP-binding protein [Bacteroidota bacterium]
MIPADPHRPTVLLRGVTKRFVSHGNEYPALTDVDLAAYPGQLQLLLGPSGSGKTTLFTIAAGFVSPTAGSVALFGNELHGLGPRMLQRLRAMRIGFVFQTFLLIEAFTAAENIDLQLRFAGIRGSGIRERSLEALDLVGIPQLAGKRPNELSHGERQRVAIARSMAIDADLLIADEPTASLGTEQGAAIIRLLHSCATEHGKCVLVASHDLRLRAFADVIHTMENGRITGTEQGGAR